MGLAQDRVPSNMSVLMWKAFGERMTFDGLHSRTMYIQLASCCDCCSKPACATTLDRAFFTSGIASYVWHYLQGRLDSIGGNKRLEVGGLLVVQ